MGGFRVFRYFASFRTKFGHFAPKETLATHASRYSRYSSWSREARRLTKLSKFARQSKSAARARPRRPRSSRSGFAGLKSGNAQHAVVPGMVLSVAAFGWQEQSNLDQASVARNVGQFLNSKSIGLVDVINESGSGSAANEQFSVLSQSNDMKIFQRSIYNGTAYEFKIYGSFKDIPASAFFSTQLELDQIRKWDTSLGAVDIIGSDPKTGAELIRYVSKPPWPLAAREYVYARNAHLLDGGRLLVISSRTVDLPLPDKLGGNGNDKLQPSAPVSELYKIKHYNSLLVVRPHTTSTENGFDYMLVYHDELNVPSMLVNFTEKFARGHVKALESASRKFASEKLPAPYLDKLTADLRHRQQIATKFDGKSVSPIFKLHPNDNSNNAVATHNQSGALTSSRSAVSLGSPSIFADLINLRRGRSAESLLLSPDVFKQTLLESTERLKKLFEDKTESHRSSGLKSIIADLLEPDRFASLRLSDASQLPHREMTVPVGQTPWTMLMRSGRASRSPRHSYVAVEPPLAFRFRQFVRSEIRERARPHTVNEEHIDNIRSVWNRRNEMILS